MQKKIFYTIFLIIAVLTVFSCSSGDKYARGAKNIIIGKWQGVKFGNTIIQLGLSLPATYYFKKDGSFESSLNAAGIQTKFSGRYYLDTSHKPVIIRIKRNNGREFHGIIEFINNGKFRMVLYDRRILPLAKNFGKNDSQIYKRID